MSRVVLGNRHATDSLDNGETRFALPRGKRATVVDLPEDWTLAQSFLAITSPTGVWATHTSATDEESGALVANDKAIPAWVASDDAALASLVASHFGGLAGAEIEIRDLEEPR